MLTQREAAVRSRRRAQRPGATSPRGRDTRHEILSVAKQLFSEFGYHHTGLSDIQAATGLTKGAFYHHFRSKEELALAVLESARSDYAARLFTDPAETQSPGARI